MHRTFLTLGALLAGLAVGLGAFGAHGLRKIADADTVSVYATGVQYQMYHALALLFTGLLLERFAASLINFAGIFFIGGIVFFSGSLYLISSLRVMNKPISPMIGIMTPFGGLLFIIGWILLVMALIKR